MTPLIFLVIDVLVIGSFITHKVIEYKLTSKLYLTKWEIFWIFVTLEFIIIEMSAVISNIN